MTVLTISWKEQWTQQVSLRISLMVFVKIATVPVFLHQSD